MVSSSGGRRPPMPICARGKPRSPPVPWPDAPPQPSRVPVRRRVTLPSRAARPGGAGAKPIGVAAVQVVDAGGQPGALGRLPEGRQGRLEQRVVVVVNWYGLSRADDPQGGGR